MPNALQHVAWEPCLIEPRPDRALEAYAKRKMGVPAPFIRYFVDCPWLAHAMVDLHPEFGLLVHLDAHLSDLISLELKEIAFVVASVDFMNRAATIPAVPSHPMERMPDQLIVQLLRPLINRILESHRSRGRATPLERAASYPYACLVKASSWDPPSRQRWGGRSRRCGPRRI